MKEESDNIAKVYNKVDGKRNDAYEVHNGDYDNLLINAFRQNIFDLRQLTSCISYNQNRSIFHKLAKYIGLPEDDDAVAFMINRLFMFNIRGIRDKIAGCNGRDHHFGLPIDINGDVPQNVMFPIKKVLINTQTYNINKPPPRPIGSIINESVQAHTTYPSPRSSSSTSSTRKIEEVKPQQVKEIPVARKISIYREMPVLKKEEMSMAIQTEFIEKLSVSFSGSSEGSSKTPIMTMEQEALAIKGYGVEITCPSCGAIGTTNVQYKIGLMTVASALGFVIFCLIPCAFVPFVCTSTKDVMHICSNCQYILGIVKKRPCMQTMTWNWELNEAEMPERFRNSKIRKSFNLGSGEGLSEALMDKFRLPT